MFLSFLGWASITSAIQVAKSLASISSLVLDTGGQAGGQGHGEVTLLEVIALSCLSYSVMSVFVYNTATAAKTSIQVSVSTQTLAS